MQLSAEYAKRIPAKDAEKIQLESALFAPILIRAIVEWHARGFK